MCLALPRAEPFVASQDSTLLLRVLKRTDSVSMMGISAGDYGVLLSLSVSGIVTLLSGLNIDTFIALLIINGSETIYNVLPMYSALTGDVIATWDYRRVA